ncbi:MAG: hypothetical protein JXR94_15380 [Candidatus Hydrogenedentes bacterium]|nr:hypothetical protein [Candidatus Hydrogenedentota bacterium]
MAIVHEPQPTRMQVIESIERAIQHTKRVLFQPFTFSKWLCLGLIAFLDVVLGGGGKGGGFSYNPYGGFGSQGPGGGGTFHPAEMIGKFEGWIGAHLGVILAIAIPVLLLWAGLILVSQWLGARGQMMFIRAVARDEAALGVNWRETRGPAWSLFLFRVCLAFAGTVVVAGLGAAAYLSVRVIALGDVREISPYVFALLPYLLVAIAIGIGFGVVSALLRSFVAPLMLHLNQPCLQTWGSFGHILRGNWLPILGFFGLKLLYSMGFGIVAALAGCITCCIGGLPVIHHTLFAPYYVFDRSVSLFMLQSLGPEYAIVQMPDLPGDIPPELPPEPGPLAE